ncbi:outer membrane protein assembly factor BamB [Thiomicrorhabdus sediminis]|uniref:Outer membrane protein assembly factor BamB n=1 Tax=Thiomicrorhabdus sediminis TaxID=2580412 RepID=A0A4P9K8G2_9GAMM|nr:outer membrane protein assembly factor BamB [Thiomicrorhabdus sediminis]QCU90587.1 outer membrane protein assembly factor BamB [Thiomicrorhabdus sediminis]
MKKPLIYFVAVFSTAGLLNGCSTPKPLVEPYMAPMESDVSIDKNWQVKLDSLPNRDVRGIAFSETDTAVFIATETGHLAALKKDNQSRWVDQVIWQSQLDSPIVSGPTLHGEQLLVGTSKGQMIALSAESGEYLWQKQLSSEVMSKAVIAEGKIFTRTVDGKLYALDSKTGDDIWVIEHQMPSLSLRGAPAVVYNDGKLFIGWESGSIQGLSAKSGERLWETRIAVPRGRTDLERMVDVQANLVFNDGYLYALGYHGRLAAINPDNGNFYFLKEVSGYRDFVVDDKGLYVVDENDVLYGFDKISGAQLWKQEAFKNRLVGDLSLFEDKLLAVDAWGYLHWMNKVQGIEIGRAKHSNDYGDGNRILRVMNENKRTYLLDDEGVITSYNVKPSNLRLFKDEHGESNELAADDSNGSGFKFSDLWPF